MSRKKRLPFWLGVVLAMVLAVLLVLVTLAPQPEDQQPAAHMNMPEQSAVVKPVEKAITRPQPEPETAADAPDRVAVPQQMESQVSHGLVLILDDVGYDISALKRLLGLSMPMAVSVLPGAPFAKQAARLANEADQVVMLHLPMQPEDDRHRLTDAFLHDGMNEEELRETFLRDLDQVPFVEGVNNHMGSKLTRLTLPMYWVMQLCREKGLFFVDSKTSADSVAAEVAASMGLAWISRNIFLDHDMNPEAMQKAWEKARDCVKKGRRCVVIAHPRAMTVDFLEQNLTTEDVSHMVSIKQLLRAPSGQTVQPERYSSSSEPVLP